MRIYIVIAITFIFSLITLNISAQTAKITLNSLSLSTGEGPVAKGLLFRSSFSHGDNLINLTLGETSSDVSYLKSIIKHKLYVGPNLKYYMGLPLIGVQATLVPFKNVSQLQES